MEIYIVKAWFKNDSLKKERIYEVFGTRHLAELEKDKWAKTNPSQRFDIEQRTVIDDEELDGSIQILHFKKEGFPTQWNIVRKEEAEFHKNLYGMEDQVFFVFDIMKLPQKLMTIWRYREYPAEYLYHIAKTYFKRYTFEDKK